MSKARAGILVMALGLLALPLSWYYSDATPTLVAQTATVDAASATQVAATGTTDDHKHLVKVTIVGEGKVKVNDEKTSLDTFRKHMEKAVQGNEDNVVIAMTCAEEVTMGMVYRVQEQLREMGLMKMSFVMNSGKGLDLLLPPLDYKGKLKDVPKEHISKLAIDGGSTVSLDGRNVGMDQLSDEIKKILSMDDKRILSVRISESATYGDFVTFLDVLKTAGATRILINDRTGYVSG